jgi:hypothetical protein
MATWKVYKAYVSEGENLVSHPEFLLAPVVTVITFTHFIFLTSLP